jgi:hypothetical protein
LVVEGDHDEESEEKRMARVNLSLKLGHDLFYVCRFSVSGILRGFLVGWFKVPGKMRSSRLGVGRLSEAKSLLA